MRGINLAGFFIEASTQKAILLVFIFYSIIILGLSAMVKLQSKRDSGSKFSSFMTGSGQLKTIEVALITATTAMAGGTMLSAPGMTYKVGFVYSMVSFTLAIVHYLTLGTYGKKYAILHERIGAETSVQLMHYRYQSKTVAITLTLITVVFLTVNAGGQLMSAAKLFGAVLGDSAYTIGLLVATGIIIVYSLAGGMKSLAKVCVVQGAFMIFAVLFLAIAEFREISAQYGSIQAAMEFVQRSNDALLSARSYTPMAALGNCILMVWGNSCNPSIIQSCMMYKDQKVMKRTILISSTIMLVISLIMSSTGPLVYALNSSITNADYSTIYLTTSLLPGWMAGIVVSAVFAAIQSSVASFVIMIAGTLTRDLYKDCINPTVSDEKLSKMNTIFFAVFGVIAVLIAVKPTTLAQTLLIFSVGGMSCSFGIPNLFGAFWKKATKYGALASCIGGFLTYIGFYILQTSTVTSAWYYSNLNNIHPIIPTIIVSLILMIFVSLATQSKKIPLGIYKVWFCKEYDEKYTTIYNSCD